MKFVIHHHRTEPDHFDLMLEQEEALLSFRIEVEDIGWLAGGPIHKGSEPPSPIPPGSEPPSPIPPGSEPPGSASPQEAPWIHAIKIHNHRKDYLTYEGPVSCDRGRVEIFDTGGYRLLETGAGFFTAEFSGLKMRGIFRFSADDIENCWTITRK